MLNAQFSLRCNRLSLITPVIISLVGELSLEGEVQEPVVPGSSVAMWHRTVEICQPLLLLPRGSLFVVGDAIDLTSPRLRLPCVLLWFDCYGLYYCFCVLSFVPPCSYLK